MRRRPIPAAGTAAGFSLAEVLVALFVVAVGLFGAAALQTRAVRAGRDAERLSTATRLAASLAERMRVNPLALGAADPPYFRSGAAASGAMACDADADCTPAQMAAYDLADTVHAAARELPGGRVRVCRDAADADPATGDLTWDCDERDGAPLVIKVGWREFGEVSGEVSGEVGGRVSGQSSGASSGEPGFDAVPRLLLHAAVDVDAGAAGRGRGGEGGAP